MSEWDRLARGVGDELGESSRREEQHRVLIDLLGAYADRELPPEMTSQIDAHLIGCARCRRELAVHHAVRHRLGDEPPVAAPPALRARIASAIAATPLPRARPLHRWRMWMSALAGAVVLVACIVATLLIARHIQPASGEVVVVPISPSAVPLLRDVLADYRRVTAGDLPGRARDLGVVRDAVPFLVEPLRGPDVRLVAAWTADLAGAPAAVLAYRRGDRIVLEYLVPEDRFFRHSELRRAVSDTRLLGGSADRQGLVAWPTRTAGAILIGDLPLDQLATMAAADLLARRVNRDAQ
jgi:anti-sigma factor RsiW